MALTRKFLSALGIESDKIDEIIEGHNDTISALKEERDESKKQINTLEKELAQVKESQTNSDEEWKKKYDDLKSEYDSFKTDIETKEARQSKIDAYKKLLQKANISDKRLESIIKVSTETIDGIEFDKDGKVKDADKLSKGIEDEWSDFIVTEGSNGADVSKPPANNGEKSKSQSLAAQIANEYHNNLYGATAKED